MRIVVLADSDSYVKWGAALAGSLDGADARLLLVESQFTVNEGQLRAALRGTGVEHLGSVTVRALPAAVAALAPDAVLVAAPGPVAMVLIRAVARLDPRPVIVSGMPGISIPVTAKALRFRRQSDLMVVHSHREVREFAELSRARGWDHRMGLARLPFASAPPPSARPRGTDLVFAPQAVVPREPGDRLYLAAMLRDAALADPSRRVVVKLRALPGERSTHPERDAYPGLVASLGPVPENLVFAAGAMSDALEHAAGLVTVSSTALLEALARGVPALAVEDLGVSAELINPVFLESGLFGDREAVIGRRFRHPDPAWLADNYFHPAAESNWSTTLEGLIAARRAGDLPPRPATTSRGRALREAWDRKRALGSADRTVGGLAALAIGHPARAAVRTIRAARRRLTPGASGQATP
ncbi:MAG: hypothetical protein QM598_01450 [Protaetiibacter sp.]